MKAIVACILLAMLCTPCFAISSNVNVSADTTVVNATGLDIGLWYFITIIGIALFVLSHVTPVESAPIWAILSPFFTFASMYFSTQLQYTYVTTYFDSTTSFYYTALQTFTYHMDWAAVGVLGVMFVFSFLNMWYILTRNPVERPGKNLNRSGMYDNNTQN
jgi:hypothetical protein